MDLVAAADLLAQSGGLNFRDNVEVIPLVAVSCCLGGPVVIGIIYVVFSSIASMVQAVVDAGLKYRMLKLGYSAADIERVLQAGSPKTSKIKACKTPASEIVVAQPIK